ncbi:hypothetical protein MPTK1_8g00170 [Marchantia polymorpha subsp. ruderalis]
MVVMFMDEKLSAHAKQYKKLKKQMARSRRTAHDLRVSREQEINNQTADAWTLMNLIPDVLCLESSSVIPCNSSNSAAVCSLKKLSDEKAEEALNVGLREEKMRGSKEKVRNAKQRSLKFATEARKRSRQLFSEKEVKIPKSGTAGDWTSSSEGSLTGIEGSLSTRKAVSPRQTKGKPEMDRDVKNGNSQRKANTLVVNYDLKTAGESRSSSGDSDTDADENSVRSKISKSGQRDKLQLIEKALSIGNGVTGKREKLFASDKTPHGAGDALTLNKRSTKPNQEKVLDCLGNKEFHMVEEKPGTRRRVIGLEESSAGEHASGRIRRASLSRKKSVTSAGEAAKINELDSRTRKQSRAMSNESTAKVRQRNKILALYNYSENAGESQQSMRGFEIGADGSVGSSSVVHSPLENLPFQNVVGIEGSFEGEQEGSVERRLGSPEESTSSDGNLGMNTSVGPQSLGGTRGRDRTDVQSIRVRKKEKRKYVVPDSLESFEESASTSRSPRSCAKVLSCDSDLGKPLQSTAEDTNEIPGEPANQFNTDVIIHSSEVVQVSDDKFGSVPQDNLTDTREYSIGDAGDSADASESRESNLDLGGLENLGTRSKVSTFTHVTQVKDLQPIVEGKGVIGRRREEGRKRKEVKEKARVSDNGSENEEESISSKEFLDEYEHSQSGNLKTVRSIGKEKGHSPTRMSVRSKPSRHQLKGSVSDDFGSESGAELSSNEPLVGYGDRLALRSKRSIPTQGYRRQIRKENSGSATQQAPIAERSEADAFSESLIVVPVTEREVNECVGQTREDTVKHGADKVSKANDDGSDESSREQTSSSESGELISNAAYPSSDMLRPNSKIEVQKVNTVLRKEKRIEQLEGLTEDASTNFEVAEDIKAAPHALPRLQIKRSLERKTPQLKNSVKSREGVLLEKNKKGTVANVSRRSGEWESSSMLLEIPSEIVSENSRSEQSLQTLKRGVIPETAGYQNSELLRSTQEDKAESSVTWERDTRRKEEKTVVPNELKIVGGSELARESNSEAFGDSQVLQTLQDKESVKLVFDTESTSTQKKKVNAVVDRTECSGDSASLDETECSTDATSESFKLVQSTLDEDAHSSQRLAEHGVKIQLSMTKKDAINDERVRDEKPLLSTRTRESYTDAASDTVKLVKSTLDEDVHSIERIAEHGVKLQYSMTKNDGVNNERVRDGKLIMSTETPQSYTDATSEIFKLEQSPLDKDAHSSERNAEHCGIEQQGRTKKNATKDEHVRDGKLTVTDETLESYTDETSVTFTLVQSAFDEDAHSTERIAEHCGIEQQGRTKKDATKDEHVRDGKLTEETLESDIDATSETFKLLPPLLDEDVLSIKRSAEHSGVKQHSLTKKDETNDEGVRDGKLAVSDDTMETYTDTTSGTFKLVQTSLDEDPHSIERNAERVRKIRHSKTKKGAINDEGVRDGKLAVSDDNMESYTATTFGTFNLEQSSLDDDAHSIGKIAEHVRKIRHSISKKGAINDEGVRDGKVAVSEETKESYTDATSEHGASETMKLVPSPLDEDAHSIERNADHVRKIRHSKTKKGAINDEGVRDGKLAVSEETMETYTDTTSGTFKLEQSSLDEDAHSIERNAEHVRKIRHSKTKKGTINDERVRDGKLAVSEETMESYTDTTSETFKLEQSPFDEDAHSMGRNAEHGGKIQHSKTKKDATNDERVRDGKLAVSEETMESYTDTTSETFKLVQSPLDEDAHSMGRNAEHGGKIRHSKTKKGAIKDERVRDGKLAVSDDNMESYTATTSGTFKLEQSSLDDDAPSIGKNAEHVRKIEHSKTTKGAINDEGVRDGKLVVSEETKELYTDTTFEHGASETMKLVPSALDEDAHSIERNAEHGANIQHSSTKEDAINNERVRDGKLAVSEETLESYTDSISETFKLVQSPSDEDAHFIERNAEHGGMIQDSIPKKDATNDERVRDGKLAISEETSQSYTDATSETFKLVQSSLDEDDHSVERVAEHGGKIRHSMGKKDDINNRRVRTGKLAVSESTMESDTDATSETLKLVHPPLDGDPLSIARNAEHGGMMQHSITKKDETNDERVRDGKLAVSDDTTETYTDTTSGTFKLEQSSFDEDAHSILRNAEHVRKIWHSKTKKGAIDGEGVRDGKLAVSEETMESYTDATSETFKLVQSPFDEDAHSMERNAEHGGKIRHSKTKKDATNDKRVRDGKLAVSEETMESYSDATSETLKLVQSPLDEDARSIERNAEHGGRIRHSKTKKGAIKDERVRDGKLAVSEETMESYWDATSETFKLVQSPLEEDSHSIERNAEHDANIQHSSTKEDAINNERVRDGKLAVSEETLESYTDSTSGTIKLVQSPSDEDAHSIVTNAEHGGMIQHIITKTDATNDEGGQDGKLAVSEETSESYTDAKSETFNLVKSSLDEDDHSVERIAEHGGKIRHSKRKKDAINNERFRNGKPAASEETMAVSEETSELYTDATSETLKLVHPPLDGDPHSIDRTAEHGGKVQHSITKKDALNHERVRDGKLTLAEETLQSYTDATSETSKIVRSPFDEDAHSMERNAEYGGKIQHRMTKKDAITHECVRDGKQIVPDEILESYTDATSETFKLVQSSLDLDAQSIERIAEHDGKAQHSMMKTDSIRDESKLDRKLTLSEEPLRTAEATSQSYSLQAAKKKEGEARGPGPSKKGRVVYKERKTASSDNPLEEFAVSTSSSKKYADGLSRSSRAKSLQEDKVQLPAEAIELKRNDGMEDVLIEKTETGKTDIKIAEGSISYIEDSDTSADTASSSRKLHSLDEGIEDNPLPIVTPEQRGRVKFPEVRTGVVNNDLKSYEKSRSSEESSNFETPGRKFSKEVSVQVVEKAYEPIDRCIDERIDAGGVYAGDRISKWTDSSSLSSEGSGNEMRRILQVGESATDEGAQVVEKAPLPRQKAQKETTKPAVQEFGFLDAEISASSSRSPEFYREAPPKNLNVLKKTEETETFPINDQTHIFQGTQTQPFHEDSQNVTELNTWIETFKTNVNETSNVPEFVQGKERVEILDKPQRSPRLRGTVKQSKKKLHNANNKAEADGASPFPRKSMKSSAYVKNQTQKNVEANYKEGQAFKRGSPSRVTLKPKSIDKLAVRLISGIREVASSSERPKAYSEKAKSAVTDLPVRKRSDLPTQKRKETVLDDETRSTEPSASSTEGYETDADEPSRESTERAEQLERTRQLRQSVVQKVQDTRRGIKQKMLRTSEGFYPNIQEVTTLSESSNVVTSFDYDKFVTSRLEKEGEVSGEALHPENYHRFEEGKYPAFVGGLDSDTETIYFSEESENDVDATRDSPEGFTYRNLSTESLYYSDGRDSSEEMTKDIVSTETLHLSVGSESEEEATRDSSEELRKRPKISEAIYYSEAIENEEGKTRGSAEKSKNSGKRTSQTVYQSGKRLTSSSNGSETDAVPASRDVKFSQSGQESESEFQRRALELEKCSPYEGKGPALVDGGVVDANSMFYSEDSEREVDPSGGSQILTSFRDKHEDIVDKTSGPLIDDKKRHYTSTSRDDSACAETISSSDFYQDASTSMVKIRKKKFSDAVGKIGIDKTLSKIETRVALGSQRIQMVESAELDRRERPEQTRGRRKVRKLETRSSADAEGSERTESSTSYTGRREFRADAPLQVSKVPKNRQEKRSTSSQNVEKNQRTLFAKSSEVGTVIAFDGIKLEAEHGLSEVSASEGLKTLQRTTGYKARDRNDKAKAAVNSGKFNSFDKVNDLREDDVFDQDGTPVVTELRQEEKFSREVEKFPETKYNLRRKNQVTSSGRRPRGFDFSGGKIKSEDAFKQMTTGGKDKGIAFDHANARVQLEEGRTSLSDFYRGSSEVSMVDASSNRSEVSLEDEQIQSIDPPPSGYDEVSVTLESKVPKSRQINDLSSRSKPSWPPLEIAGGISGEITKPSNVMRSNLDLDSSSQGDPHGKKKVQMFNLASGVNVFDEGRVHSVVKSVESESVLASSSKDKKPIAHAAPQVSSFGRHRRQIRSTADISLIAAKSISSSEDVDADDDLASQRSKLVILKKEKKSPHIERALKTKVTNLNTGGKLLKLDRSERNYTSSSVTHFIRAGATSQVDVGESRQHKEEITTTVEELYDKETPDISAGLPRRDSTSREKNSGEIVQEIDMLVSVGTPEGKMLKSQLLAGGLEVASVPEWATDDRFDASRPELRVSNPEEIESLGRNISKVAKFAFAELSTSGVQRGLTGVGSSPLDLSAPSMTSFIVGQTREDVLTSKLKELPSKRGLEKNVESVAAKLRDRSRTSGNTESKIQRSVETSKTNDMDVGPAEQFAEYGTSVRTESKDGTHSTSQGSSAKSQNLKQVAGSSRGGIYSRDSAKHEKDLNEHHTSQRQRESRTQRNAKAATHSGRDAQYRTSTIKGDSSGGFIPPNTISKLPRNLDSKSYRDLCLPSHSDLGPKVPLVSLEKSRDVMQSSSSSHRLRQNLDVARDVFQGSTPGRLSATGFDPHEAKASGKGEVLSTGTVVNDSELASETAGRISSTTDLGAFDAEIPGDPSSSSTPKSSSAETSWLSSIRTVAKTFLDMDFGTSSVGASVGVAPSANMVDIVEKPRASATLNYSIEESSMSKGKVDTVKEMQASPTPFDELEPRHLFPEEHRIVSNHPTLDSGVKKEEGLLKRDQGIVGAVESMPDMETTAGEITSSPKVAFSIAKFPDPLREKKTSNIFNSLMIDQASSSVKSGKAGLVMPWSSEVQTDVAGTEFRSVEFPPLGYSSLLEGSKASTGGTATSWNTKIKPGEKASKNPQEAVSLGSTTSNLKDKRFHEGVPLSSSSLHYAVAGSCSGTGTEQTSGAKAGKRKVTPLTLGLETAGGVMTVIIPRNTPVPTTKRQLAELDEIDLKRLELQNICNPILESLSQGTSSSSLALGAAKRVTPSNLHFAAAEGVLPVPVEISQRRTAPGIYKGNASQNSGVLEAIQGKKTQSVGISLGQGVNGLRKKTPTRDSVDDHNRLGETALSRKAPKAYAGTTSWRSRFVQSGQKSKAPIPEKGPTFKSKARRKDTRNFGNVFRSAENSSSSFEVFETRADTVLHRSKSPQTAELDTLSLGILPPESKVLLQEETRIQVSEEAHGNIRTVRHRGNKSSEDHGCYSLGNSTFLENPVASASKTFKEPESKMERNVVVVELEPVLGSSSRVERRRKKKLAGDSSRTAKKPRSLLESHETLGDDTPRSFHVPQSAQVKCSPLRRLTSERRGRILRKDINEAHKTSEKASPSRETHVSAPDTTIERSQEVQSVHGTITQIPEETRVPVGGARVEDNAGPVDYFSENPGKLASLEHFPEVTVQDSKLVESGMKSNVEFAVKEPVARSQRRIEHLSVKKTFGNGDLKGAESSSLFVDSDKRFMFETIRSSQFIKSFKDKAFSGLYKSSQQRKGSPFLRMKPGSVDPRESKGAGSSPTVLASHEISQSKGVHESLERSQGSMLSSIGAQIRLRGVEESDSGHEAARASGSENRIEEVLKIKTSTGEVPVSCLDPDLEIKAPHCSREGGDTHLQLEEPVGSSSEIAAEVSSGTKDTTDEGPGYSTPSGGVALSRSELDTEAQETFDDVRPGMLSGLVEGVQTRRLRKVTPLTLGLETAGGVMTVIIPRNTSVPVRKRQVVSTHIDDQTEVLVDIYEGERLWVKDNNLLGRFELKGIAPAPRGVPQITVLFDIDAEGVMNVFVEGDTTIGGRKMKGLAVTNVSVRPDRQKIREMIGDSEKHKAEDEHNRKSIALKDSLENYVYTLRSILKDESIARLLDPRSKIDMIAGVQSALEWLMVCNWLLYNHRQIPDFREVDAKRRELQSICKPVERILRGQGNFRRS